MIINHIQMCYTLLFISHLLSYHQAAIYKRSNDGKQEEPPEVPDPMTKYTDTQNLAQDQKQVVDIMNVYMNQFSNYQFDERNSKMPDDIYDSLQFSKLSNVKPHNDLYNDYTMGNYDNLKHENKKIDQEYSKYENVDFKKDYGSYDKQRHNKIQVKRLYHCLPAFSFGILEIEPSSRLPNCNERHLEISYTFLDLNFKKKIANGFLTGDSNCVSDKQEYTAGFCPNIRKYPLDIKSKEMTIVITDHYLQVVNQKQANDVIDQYVANHHNYFQYGLFTLGYFDLIYNKYLYGLLYKDFSCLIFTIIYGYSVFTLIYKYIKLKLLKKKEKELQIILEDENQEESEEKTKPKAIKPKTGKMNCTIEKDDENDDVYLCCESTSQPNLRTRRLIKSATPFQIFK